MEIADRARELLRPYYLRWIYFRLHPQARPPSFAACWRFPSSPVEETPRPEQERPGVIFYPMNDWHTRFQRTQQLAVAFSRLGYRCLYLNPHLGRQFEEVRHGAQPHRIGVLGEDLYELHVRLPREPVFHHRALASEESNVVRDTVAAAIHRLRMTGSCQVVSFPLWFDAAAGLRVQQSLPLVYDCHDLLEGFGNVAAELVADEPRQLHGADTVLFSSEGLREHFAARDRGLAARSILLRNGVDFEQFNALARQGVGPAEAVYTGALDHWFDGAGLRDAARANPACRISLIGRPEGPQIQALTSEPNVRFLGEVEYTRLPALLAEARVGLIPFQVNSLTLATNPIKLYEYFSLGMPVVSSALPEVERFGDLVYIAAGSGGLAKALADALAEDDPVRRCRRQEIARTESWRERASLLSAEFRRLRS